MLKHLGLHRLFGKSAAEHHASEISAPTLSPGNWIRPTPGTLILVVDDSRTTQAVVGKKLGDQGYATLSALDAESGIELARRTRPALILMDVIMPGINGFQATRAIRRDEHLGHIPVIIMSGNKEATEQFWSLKIGANDYMRKPFTDAELFTCIEKCLFSAACTDTLPVSEPA